MDKPLSPKQARFVAEYLVDLNGTLAAVRAGYSPRSANPQAARLLAKDSVRAAVAEGKAAAAEATGVTAQRVRDELAKLAFHDVAQFWDDAGNLRAISEIPADARAAIAGLEIVQANLDPTDGKKDSARLRKIRLADKTKALELLGKHLGLFEESARLSGTIELVWAKE